MRQGISKAMEMIFDKSDRDRDHVSIMYFVLRCHESPSSSVPHGAAPKSRIDVAFASLYMKLTTCSKLWLQSSQSDFPVRLYSLVELQALVSPQSSQEGPPPH
jgi:hypothetical protein